MAESVPATASPRTCRRDARRRRKAFARVLATAALALPLAFGPHAPSAGAQPDLVGGLAVPQTDPDARLLVEADTLVYDFDNDTISAIGNVEIRYAGYTLYANQVTLDRKKGEFRALKGARLYEPDGNVAVAEEIVLSDDFRDGFLAGLRVDTIQRTRFAAESAERIGGETTVFHNGVYTACYSCLARPDRPPTWQIKARKIVHNKTEQVVYYEDPRIEFWGVPVAYLPFLSHPDPTVRRKSGILVPDVIFSNLLGAGIRVPYFRTLGPSRDITVAVTPLTRQGVLGDVAYRQRLVNGAYSIRAAGIWQADPGAFEMTSGNRRFRGAVGSEGKFYINPRWWWGWETTVTTDRSFLRDYKQDNGSDETAISTLYLTGLGVRNYVDVRGYGFRVLQEDYDSDVVLDPPSPFSPVGSDLQRKQPIVHPVMDYDGVLDSSVAGGELAWRLNLTSLSRAETDAFGAFDNGVLEPRFRGIEGTFSRTSGEATWRRRFVDPFGQVFTPSAGLRGDVFYLDNRDPNVTELDEDAVAARGMPWVGMEYRWPWLVTHPLGTQTVEPVAQIIARPNETLIGELPNEDAQSIVLDDTTLFRTDKFSGFDRVEGGTRANLGLRYTVQSYSGGFVSALVGQSFQLTGRNSYAVPDILDSTAGSGLTTAESNYVASLYLDTNGGLQVNTQALFDNRDLSLDRTEVQVSGRSGPVSSKVIYAFLRKQPELGIVEDQQEVQGAASLQVLEQLRLFGQLRYDLENREVIREGVGVGYDDDSLSVSLAYAIDRSGDVGTPTDRTLFLRVGLRTLGDADLSSGLGN